MNANDFVYNVVLKLRDKLNGDSVYNARTYIYRTIESLSVVESNTMLNYIEHNQETISDTFGIHIDRVLWIVYHAKKRVK